MMSPTTQVSSSCLAWDAQGFLALPDDSYESYSKRVSKFQKAGACADSAACESLVKTYRIDPAWVPVEYSNKGLRLWEAGCTWYADEADICPTIQLASHFEHAATYLGIYRKDEVLSHEYVHAVRAGLGSSAFEEIFAYLLSFSLSASRLSKIMRGFRVALGPLFERSFESVILVFSLIPVLLIAVKDFFVDSYNASLLSMLFIPTLLISAGIAAFFALRLCLRWWQWCRCKKRLGLLLGGSCLPLMVRLLDEEIILFSAMKPEEIREWILSQGTNFRWQLLATAYCYDAWK